mgnify:CR=1 FL=1
MNRLTEKDDRGNWELKGIRWQQLYIGQIITKEVQEKLYGALHKLLDYEEVGLNPDEVESLKEENEWIPIKYREITDKERAEEHIPDNCKYRHICDMPEDEERILVTNFTFQYGSTLIHSCQFRIFFMLICSFLSTSLYLFYFPIHFIMFFIKKPLIPFIYIPLSTSSHFYFIEHRQNFSLLIYIIYKFNFIISHFIISALHNFNFFT